MNDTHAPRGNGDARDARFTTGFLIDLEDLMWRAGYRKTADDRDSARWIGHALRMVVAFEGGHSAGEVLRGGGGWISGSSGGVA